MTAHLQLIQPNNENRSVRAKRQIPTRLHKSIAVPSLCPLPSALCPLPSALCPLPFAVLRIGATLVADCQFESGRKPDATRTSDAIPTEAQAAHSPGTLVRQLSEASRREIEDLVGRLMAYHKKLQTEGERIQLDIEDYADLNHHVRQLTTIVSDSVGKLPVAVVLLVILVAAMLRFS